MIVENAPKKLFGGVLVSISKKYKLPVSRLRIGFGILAIAYIITRIFPFFIPFMLLWRLQEILSDLFLGAVVLYAILWIIQPFRFTRSKQDLEPTEELVDQNTVESLSTKIRWITNINIVLCALLTLASPGFILASAMSFANGQNETARSIGFIMTLGLPIITIVSMFVFWRQANKSREKWLRASLVPWLYLACFFFILQNYMF